MRGGSQWIKMPVSMSGQYQFTKVVTSYPVKDLVLVPLEGKLPELGGKALLLNNVAAFIWKQIEANVHQESILSAILSNFTVNKQEAERDLGYFMETLVYLGIVREVKGKLIKPQPPITISEPGPWRHPKIYVYDLETGAEAQFGPHICGRSWVHRTMASAWHGGCC